MRKRAVECDSSNNVPVNIGMLPHEIGGQVPGKQLREMKSFSYFHDKLRFLEERSMLPVTRLARVQLNKVVPWLKENLMEIHVTLASKWSGIVHSCCCRYCVWMVSMTA